MSFRIAHGDRVGLVGPNGTGKTSLLRIAAGLDAPDAGAVAYARGTRVGFLRQELLEEATGTVIEHARGAAAHLRELERELRDLEGQIATGDPELLERYADAQHHFEHAGGYDFEGTLARIPGLDSVSRRSRVATSVGREARDSARATGSAHPAFPPYERTTILMSPP